MIVAMRLKWPQTPILIGKADLDAAYRRLHVRGAIAATCISILGTMAFICLRLPFGTSPAPGEYTAISKAIMDLGNDLLADITWDPDILHSPNNHLMPEPEYLNDEPFAQAHKLDYLTFCHLNKQDMSFVVTFPTPHPPML